MKFLIKLEIIDSRKLIDMVECLHDNRHEMRWNKRSCKFSASKFSFSTLATAKEGSGGTTLACQKIDGGLTVLDTPAIWAAKRGDSCVMSAMRDHIENCINNLSRSLPIVNRFRQDLIGHKDQHIDQVNQGLH